MNTKVMVACRNANGEADMYVCDVTVTDEAFQLGKHYDIAEAMAEAEGYEPPFLCFDKNEQRNIARQVSKLDCPIPFPLTDKSDDYGDSVNAAIIFGWDGLSVQLDGYSDCCSEDNKGIVAYLEYWGSSANLRAYADINSEEPSHVISLEGAKNTNRKEL
ncbi:hypothetical protein ACNO5E_13295 [Vibrio parahaemolyticus]|uniref:hypothetical protein n=1 Tax=Vibrio parahaemolyticus TaxID=670 RepID=UPI0008138B25|nr:hypothetical protein [Vibrio parahaemolyticus]OCP68261.1 hypothetical protein AKH08_15705 [Vibrio parahaemolyticus]